MDSIGINLLLTSMSIVFAAPRVMLVTVSDDRDGRKGGLYRQTQDRLRFLFMNNPQYGITDFQMWRHETVQDTPEYEENKEQFDNKDAELSGRAYKPLAIYHAMMSLNEGDFLIYTDTSPGMWKVYLDSSSLPSSEYSVDVLKQLVTQNGDILSNAVIWHHENNPGHPVYKNVKFRPKPNGIDHDIGEHTHRFFTLDRCIELMKMGAYRHSYQHASGNMAFRKSHKSVRFISNWLFWNLKHPECSSTKYWAAEANTKIGHRTDQSISGLLINDMNGNLLLPHTNDGARNNPFNFLEWSRRNVKHEFINSNTRSHDWSGWAYPSR